MRDGRRTCVVQSGLVAGLAGVLLAGTRATILQAALLAHGADAFFHNHQFDNHVWVLIGLSLVLTGMREEECAPATSTR